MGKKIVELEAVRGIAACVVLVHHFLLTFLPHLHGRNFPDDPIALVRTPAYALINGSAAVAVFFVLSGFVLTVRAFEDRRASRLVVGIFKRWPRLVPAVLAVNLLSAVLLAFGLYRHIDRTWLDPASYANVYVSASEEGVWSTFFHGTSAFNVSIWTMHYELIGSVLCYVTALAMLFARDLRMALAIGAICIAGVAATGDDGIVFSTLIIGVLIARLYVAGLPTLRWPFLVAALVVAVVCTGYDGYSKPVGFYAFMAPYASPATEHIVHAIGAALIIALVLFTPSVRRALAGSLGLWLGRLSFPIYLVHWPILMGVVFHLHGWLAVYGELTAIPVSFGCFIGLTLICALPIMYLDEWWVGFLSAPLRDENGIEVDRIKRAARAAPHG